MFEKNMLTFNAGWNNCGENLQSFTDVRELQLQLKTRGIVIASEADESTTGPVNFMIIDPDGNPILADQQR